MKKKIAAAVVAIAMLSGCSSFDGQLGREDSEFVDGYGRNCTAIKWGESASLDCDYPIYGPAAEND